MGYHVLLTGATGFLGSHLLAALLDAGHSVTILQRSTSNVWRIRYLLDRVNVYEIDRVPVDTAFREQRIDGVIHTACEYGRHGETLCNIADVNLMFGLQVAEAACTHNAVFFINTDTFSNRGGRIKKHLNAYTVSKRQFVEWLKLFSDHIKIVNLKLHHLYGPRDNADKFIPWVVANCIENVPRIELTQGHQRRDFIYVDDAVQAYLHCFGLLNRTFCFKEIDVCTGVTIPLREMVCGVKQAVAEYMRRPVDTILGFGAIPYEKNEMMEVSCNNLQLIKTGWKPLVSNEEGVKAVVEDMLQRLRAAGCGGRSTGETGASDRDPGSALHNRSVMTDNV